MNPPRKEDSHGRENPALRDPLHRKRISQSYGKGRKAGISVSALIRKSVADCEVKEAPPADLHKLIWEIRRVGSNIDQILTIANAKGLLDVPHLRKTISDLREVEKLIAVTYEQPRQNQPSSK